MTTSVFRKGAPDRVCMRVSSNPTVVDMRGVRRTSSTSSRRGGFPVAGTVLTPHSKRASGGHAEYVKHLPGQTDIGGAWFLCEMHMASAAPRCLERASTRC